tara:strand:- start:322 stop:2223 length:1902 start_codon:yes stop_codon:yes gene_type:complete
MPIVELPDGQKLEFPEGMSQDEMRNAIHSNFPNLGAPVSSKEKPTQPQEPSYLQQAGKVAQKYVIDPSEAMIQGPIRSATLGVANLPLQLLQGGANIMAKGLGDPQGHADLTKYARYPAIAGAAEMAAGLALPGVGSPEKLGLAGRGIASVLEGAGYGGLFGAAKGDAVGGAKLGAGLGLGGRLVAETIPKSGELATKALRKLGARTPQQVERIKRAMKETKVDLGTLIDNPWMTETFMRIGHVPFSGIRPVIEKALNKDSEIAQKAIRRLSYGESRGAIPGSIANDISKVSSKVERIKQENYGIITSESSKAGINVNKRPELRRYSKEVLSKHRKTLSTGDTSALSNEAVAELEKSVKPDIDSGISKEIRDVETAMHTWSSLQERSRKSGQDGNKYESGIYWRMANSLDNDIEGALKTSGRDDLHALWIDSKKQFKDDVLPFRSREIKSIIEQGPDFDPDKVHTKLMKGKHDDVVRQLPEKTKHQIAHQHYTQGAHLDEDGNRVLSSAFVHGKHRTYPERMKEHTFDESDLAGLDQLAAIKKMMSEYKIQRKKPPTGMRASSMLAHGVVGYEGALHPLMAASGVGAARGLKKILTSDALADLYATGKIPTNMKALKEVMERVGRVPQIEDNK